METNESEWIISAKWPCRILIVAIIVIEVTLIALVDHPRVGFICGTAVFAMLLSVVFYGQRRNYVKINREGIEINRANTFFRYQKQTVKWNIIRQINFHCCRLNYKGIVYVWPTIVLKQNGTYVDFPFGVFWPRFFFNISRVNRISERKIMVKQQLLIDFLKGVGLGLCLYVLPVLLILVVLTGVFSVAAKIIIGLLLLAACFFMYAKVID